MGDVAKRQRGRKTIGHGIDLWFCLAVTRSWTEDSAEAVLVTEEMGRSYCARSTGGISLVLVPVIEGKVTTRSQRVSGIDFE
jgi:hypothetical protein